MSQAPALVIAAHGSRDGRHELLERLAARARARCGAPAVLTAYHRGGTPFAEVLDRLGNRSAVVVPLLASDGYYTRAVLPRELARNRRVASVRMVITPPIGVHRRVPDLVARHLHRQAGSLLRRPGSVLVIVSHGTRRIRASARSAGLLRAGLVRRRVASRVRIGFLDQEPLVETVIAPDAVTVVFPFLIGFGEHAQHDVPARVTNRTGRVIITRPFGTLGEIPALIADCYRRGVAELAA